MVASLQMFTSADPTVDEEPDKRVFQKFVADVWTPANQKLHLVGTQMSDLTTSPFYVCSEYCAFIKWHEVKCLTSIPQIINNPPRTRHCLHKILKQVCKRGTARKKKKRNSSILGCYPPPSCTAPYRPPPPTVGFSGLIKNSRGKTPGMKYVFNFTEVKLPISRPIPV